MVFIIHIDKTPLHYACQKRHFDIVQLLLLQPNINIKRSDILY